MTYEVKNIDKSFGNLKVLDNISISFPENKTTCILGPSGCGKTTLLNIIAGLLDEDSGELIGFENKDISFVFQEDRLIPWKNVEDNLAFVLKKNTDKREVDKLINHYLELVSLEKYKHYYPKDLSGGMKQRINILRAFIYDSKILIMDEPFKSLDIDNKQIVMDFFEELMKIEKRTCIMVTHNIEEAEKLGDRIVMLTDKPTRVGEIIEG